VSRFIRLMRPYVGEALRAVRQSFALRMKAISSG
jgi:hypothetical protein